MTRRDQRGSVTTELVIVLPVVFGILFSIIQGGLFYYGREVARHAASAAVSAATSVGGATADGRSAAAEVLDQMGSGLLAHPTIDVVTTGTQVHATITGQAPDLTPFLTLPAISQSATGSIERFTTEG